MLLLFLINVIGIKLNGGMDGYNIRDENYNFRLADTNIAFMRSKISNMFSGGVSIFMDMLPINIEVGGEISGKSYKYKCDVLKPSEGSASFGRISGSLTLLKDIWAFPPVVKILSIPFGIGVNFHFITPILDSAIIKENIKSISETVAPDKLLERKTKMGIHFQSGIKLKLPVLPFGIVVFGKYNYIPRGKKVEKIPNYWQIYLSLIYKLF